MPIGYSFQPGAESLRLNQQGGRGVSGMAPQEAVKFLSLRLPERPSPTAIAPQALLQAQGGQPGIGGSGDLRAVIQGLMQLFGGGGQQDTFTGGGAPPPPRVRPPFNDPNNPPAPEPIGPDRNDPRYRDFPGPISGPLNIPRENPPIDFPPPMSGPTPIPEAAPGFDLGSGDTPMSRKYTPDYMTAPPPLF